MSNKPVAKKETAKTLSVTSLNDLSVYASGSVIELPSFASGQPFVARLKRPSMLVLAKRKKIPNKLLLTANDLFAGAGMDQTQETSMESVFEIIDVICEACFVEPTYEEIKASGVELTDEQMMFIFNYTQTGVNALESFRIK